MANLPLRPGAEASTDAAPASGLALHCQALIADMEANIEKNRAITEQGIAALTASVAQQFPGG